MKKYAVIVAGGSGLRMNTDVPKQFMLLRGKPVVQYAIEAFINAFPDVEIILVLPAAHFGQGKAIVHTMNLSNKIHIAAGGDTRFNSVKNGLAFVTEPSVVFVHDAARCLVTKDLIERCYQQAVVKGSAIPAVSATDSIRIEMNNAHQSIERSCVKIIQTPQAFQSHILLPAFQHGYHRSYTDEASVVEANGHEIFLIEGDYDNIKITRPADLFIAEKILESLGV